MVDLNKRPAIKPLVDPPPAAIVHGASRYVRSLIGTMEGLVRQFWQSVQAKLLT